MVKSKVRSKLKRIDIEMEQMIEEYSAKNEVSVRQASKELAQIMRKSFSKNKLTREIKF